MHICTYCTKYNNNTHVINDTDRSFQWCGLPSMQVKLQYIYYMLILYLLVHIVYHVTMTDPTMFDQLSKSTPVLLSDLYA